MGKIKDWFFFKLLEKAFQANDSGDTSESLEAEEELLEKLPKSLVLRYLEARRTQSK